MFSITLSTERFLLLILSMQFRSYEFTTVLSPADRVVNGQDVELVCSYSLTIDPASRVFVNWVEGGTTRGNIDKNCNDTFGPVNTTQYGFSCLSIQNYTWTIKNVQETRNGSVWACEIAIDSPNYEPSDPTTIYVISPITNVSIDGNTNINADAGSQTTVLCTTSTGRPVSTIHWYFDAGTPSDTSDDKEITSTLEPVFDFGSETTSGSVTITAESNRTGWGIYATANNTELMTPIQSPRVTLTVTGSTGSTSDGCKICKWCKIFPWWCIIIIVIILIIIVVVCTLGYWRYKRIYLFKREEIVIPANENGGKPPDGERIASASHVEMGGISSEKSSFVPKGLSGIYSGRSAGTGSRVLSTTDETSHETNLSRTTVHVDNQVNDKTKGRRNLPPIIGNAKVVPDGNLEKNTAGQITEVNNTHRALPKPPGIGSEVSSQEPNMGDVEANKQKRKKKKKKKSKETEKDQIV